MILPRAGLDAIQQEYMDYSKNKPTKGYLNEIFKLIDSGMKTFNIYIFFGSNAKAVYCTKGTGR